ncbi:MAG: hypothetical protein ACE5DX_03960 [Candidatus Dojkabacteria bacterium]
MTTTETIFNRDSLPELRTQVFDALAIHGLDERHNFRVSTENIPITEHDIETLHVLSGVIPDYFNGLGRFVNICLINDKLRRKSPLFRSLRKALGLGSAFAQVMSADEARGGKPQTDRDLAAEAAALSTTISGHHPFARFDLIKEDGSGRLRIAEIEEGKLHGFGYATLCRELSDTLVGSGIADEIARIANIPTGMVLSGHERFYEFEAGFFVSRVRSLSGDLFLIPQERLLVDDDGVAKSIGFQPGQRMAQLLNLPPQFRMSKREDTALTDKLNEHHQSGKINILSHRMPLLGEKTPMALLSNATGNTGLEELLTMCFHPDTLSILRTHLPATELPLDSGHRRELQERITAGELMYVKVVNSSGAKGIGTPGEIETQLELIKRGGRVICQEAVHPEQKELPGIDLLTGDITTDDHTVRYSLFVVDGRLADLGITASPSIIAHGGVQSIQTGVTLQS